ncbi:unnamed protein product [Symbiodinium natans]|uniref:Uncharacterized protein n=1 Tax=Symbiodinium natans TaxID=878477 RepID=A0A812QB91_9DINO|nr:unnamed protein product [Symbiodinium natans]
MASFVGGSNLPRAPAVPRSQVAMKAWQERQRFFKTSVGPVPVQLPWMSEPMDGFTFALYMMGLFLVVASFGDELGSYEEIKWGGARPPKEYVEEMKRIEARRKRRYLDLKSVSKE